jgi:hypothetical protein
LVQRIRNCATVRSLRLRLIVQRHTAEDALSVVRFFVALAIAASAAALATGGARAQFAASPPARVALLAGLDPPHHTARTPATTKPAAHARTAHKVTVKHERKIAGHWRHPHIAALAVEPSPPAEIAKPVIAPLPEQAPLESVTAPQTVSEAAPAPDEPAPQAVAVNGQTVEVASPDEINDIDRVAADQTSAESKAADDDTADATPASHAVFAAPARDDARAGGKSWTAQVLAALGGAIAAAAVAWFLIGSGPVRTYAMGEPQMPGEE